MRVHAVLSIAFACVLAAPTLIAGDRRPSDWGGGPNGYDVALDSETKLSGNSSVRLSRTDAATEHRFGTIVQAIDATEFAGKRLRFFGYVKTDDVTEYAGLWLRVDSKERGTVAFDNMRQRPITGTNDWYRYEIVLDVPDDGAMIHFGALLTGGGTIWIDDLSLDVVSNETETTRDAMIPTEHKVKIPATLSSVPKNLSFES